jgi:peptide methionine sulfoxide reductase MsrA
MSIHSHKFVETYEGLVGFGADRETDENTVVYYLQKFSDDRLMKTIIKRLSDEELAEIFSLITRLLKEHLDSPEYHQIFLKEDSRAGLCASHEEAAAEGCPTMRSFVR